MREQVGVTLSDLMMMLSVKQGLPLFRNHYPTFFTYLKETYSETINTGMREAMAALVAKQNPTDVAMKMANNMQLLFDEMDSFASVVLKGGLQHQDTKAFEAYMAHKKSQLS